MSGVIVGGVIRGGAKTEDEKKGGIEVEGGK